jgi:hypothetical protein
MIIDFEWYLILKKILLWTVGEVSAGFIYIGFGDGI